MTKAIRDSALAALAGTVAHYALFFLAGTPLWTETIAEWIMMRTPSHSAVAILEALGAWAKPFAVTGGLAAMGLGVFVAALVGTWRRKAMPLAAAAMACLYGVVFGYGSWLGQVAFWIPAAAVLALPDLSASPSAPRRRFLTTTAVMGSGALAVAVESFLRNQALARRAVAPVELFPFEPPPDGFAPGLVRKPVTPVGEFYGMSKNAVDPSIDPNSWRLLITVKGRPVAEYVYAELLALPRVRRYVTLRCVSNTLDSDLMGTALWAGVYLGQLVDRKSLPPEIVEVAFIGADGHDDSLAVDYAFSQEVLLALGMNGKTLNRTHGFPMRLLAPRYYGFKNAKWIREIAFVDRPYYGVWPKMGFTREPLIHTMSHIDRILPAGGLLRVGGVSFAGDRGVREVLLRTGQGPWVKAQLEPPLSPYTWTRWQGALAAVGRVVEARAQDGTGAWQAQRESDLFPGGISGPTIRRIPT